MLMCLSPTSSLISRETFELIKQPTTAWRTEEPQFSDILSNVIFSWELWPKSHSLLKSKWRRGNNETNFTLNVVQINLQDFAFQAFLLEWKRVPRESWLALITVVKIPQLCTNVILLDSVLEKKIQYDSPAALLGLISLEFNKQFQY